MGSVLPRLRLTTYKLKEYISEKVKAGKSWSTVNLTISAINRFHIDTLGEENILDRVARPRGESKLPSVFSTEEVEKLLGCVKNMKHRVLLMTIYSAGLRIGEACRLKIKDIDSGRMRLIVRDGKGHKDREVILSRKLLVVLREYFGFYQPEVYLFNGRTPGMPYSISSTKQVFGRALRASKINKKACTHTLRHSYATHLMDKGIDVRIIQSLLGHKSISTTMLYCHLSKSKYAEVSSPLDDLISI
jgi:integrase/recombinase XerD